MRFLGTLAASVIIGLFLGPRAQLDGQESKVLLIVKEGSSQDMELVLAREVEVMRNLLRGAGFAVDVASASGNPLTGGATTVDPDLSLDEVDAADYVGIILPGMGMDPEPSLPRAEDIVRQALTAGRPVAAQASGVVTLARAGVLLGREFAFVEDWVEEVEEFQGARHGGEGVIRDGNVITSAADPFVAASRGMEDGTQALTGTFIQRIWATY